MRRSNQHIVEQIPFIMCLHKRMTMEMILGLFKTHAVTVGETIIEKNHVPKAISIILNGKFINESTGESIPVGTMIGLYSLWHHEHFPYTIRATRQNSTVLQLTASRFAAVLDSIDDDLCREIQNIIDQERTDVTATDDQKRDKKNTTFEYDPGLITFEAVAKRTIQEVEVDGGSVLMVRDRPPPKEMNITTIKERTVCSIAKSNADKRARHMITAAKYTIDLDCAPTKTASETQKHASLAEVASFTKQRYKCEKKKIEKDPVMNRLQPVGRSTTQDWKNDKGLIRISSKRGRQINSG